jgi:hypothetical protein
MNTDNIWVSAGSVTPIASQYAGYYAERQSRFYVRSLRRDGVFIIDFPTVALWDVDACAWDNGLWTY